MAVVRQYGLPEQEARGVQNPYPQTPAAGDLATFGGNTARDLQQAGANLERTGDTVFGIYERAAKEANDTKVEGDLNTFISGKQKALIDYSQTRGQDAIDGAKTVSDGLVTMKTQLLDGAKNAYQRDALSRRLDAQMLDATGTVTQHVAQQSRALQVSTLDSRSKLNVIQGTLDRDDGEKLDGLLRAQATLGLEKARLAGNPPDSDQAKVAILEEQGKALVAVIQAQITDGNKRKALAIYDKYPGILKHNASVDSVMKGVRDDIDAENDANAALRNAGMPQTGSGEGKDQFIRRMTPHALEVSKATGLDPRLVLAQSALETGYGAAAPGNNYFGIKSHAQPGGQTLSTTEVGPGGAYQTKDSFRAYASPGESAADYANFLKSNSRYAPVLEAKGLDAQIDAMGKSGYATDPNYASKLRQIAQSLPDPAGGEGAFGGTVINARGGAGGQTLYKGDLKVGYEQAKAELQNRTDITPERRTKALALLNAAASNVTSFQAASVKALEDESNAYRTQAYVTGNVDPARMASFAARADGLGQQEMAQRYRMLATLAPTATNTLQSMPSDQFNMLKSLEKGLPGELLGGIRKGDAEIEAQAGTQFDALKKGQKDGIAIAGLEQIASDAARLYATAGKGGKAKEVAEFFATATAAAAVGQGTPTEQKAAQARIEAAATTGQVTSQQVAAHGMVKDIIAAQKTAFDKDPYPAGLSAFGMVALPLTDGPGRSQQANEIAQRRELPAGSVAPLSVPEFDALRARASASPQAAEQVFQQLAAAGYDPAMAPAIGAGIAGKDQTDKVSQGYAAAFNFYAEKEPEIAGLILRGTHLRKTSGDALKDMPKDSAFYDAVQTRMGNAFRNFPGAPGQANVPSIIVNAAEAIYTAKMVAAGRQGEKALDDTVFGAALDMVIGKPFSREGNMLVPPKGVDAHAFDNAINRLPNMPLVGLATENGTPVTTDKMARYGIFSNAGKDGQYYVQMNDPARGNRPAYVVSPGPRHEPLIVDIMPLLEDVKRNPRGTDLPSGGRAAPRVIGNPEPQPPEILGQTPMPTPTERLRRLVPPPASAPADHTQSAVQRFAGDGFGGGREGRALWRDAPSVFDGAGSTNVEDRRRTKNAPAADSIPQPTDEPPAGLALPNSMEEMLLTMAREKGPEAVKQAMREIEDRRKYERERERIIKERGLRDDRRR